VDLIPWTPFADVRPRPLLDRILDDPWRFVATGGNGPAVEVFERGEDVVIRAEIAGVDPRDLDVRLAEDGATIRGERRAEERGDPEGYYRSERQYGSFVRTVALPSPVDPSRAKAQFRHGLLEIVAPRKQDDTRRGRRIDVQVQ